MGYEKRLLQKALKQLSEDPDGGPVPVMASTSSSGEVENGMVRIGESILPVADHRPVVLMGGDHPYLQWYGRNGKDGVAALYNAYGVVPYIAINTNSHTQESVGAPGFMSWGQIKELSDAGMVELISHGARHYQDHEAPDAGIHVKYAGSAATATMYVTSTAIVGVTAGAVNDFTLTFSSYPTLGALVAAINTVTGWSAMTSPELTGNEPSSLLLTISSGNAKNCKSSLPDTFGQRFSAAGGIRIFWDTNTAIANSVTVHLTSSALNIYKDGVLLGTFTLASYTLAGLRDAIKALSPALASTDPLPGRDITRLIDDNGQYPYCSGVEDATSLARNLGAHLMLDAMRRPALLTAGLTPSYLRLRNQQKAKDIAAENGIELTCYAQSGGNFWRGFSGIDRVYEHYRGDNQYNPTAPISTRTEKAANWHGHFSTSHLYDNDDYITALVGAIAQSPGFTTDILTHVVVTDAAVPDGSMPGSSGYYIRSQGLAGDINEAQMVTLLSQFGALAKSGKIRFAKMREMNSIANAAPATRNWFFNPQMSSRNVIGLNTDNTGRPITGWRYDGFGLQAITKSERGISFKSGGTAKVYASQRVDIERGKRYRAGCRVTWTGVKPTMLAMRATAVYGSWPDSMVAGQARFVQGTTFSRPMEDVYLEFEVPQSPARGRARIVSWNAGPYNLSTNKNVQITLEGAAGFDIDCSAGASNSAAVTASEVAAAINSAIKASATYAAKPELWTVARAENNRVVLESPRRYGQPYSNALALTAGSTASAATAIFGAESGNAWCNNGGEDDASTWPVEVGLYVNAPSGTVVTAEDWYFQPID